MRVIFVDCANHPHCLCALGFYEPASDAKEQVRWMNAQQWPAYAEWLRQYPNDALEWTSCNPDTKTPEQVVAASVGWSPDEVTVLDYTRRSGPREIPVGSLLTESR